MIQLALYLSQWAIIGAFTLLVIFIYGEEAFRKARYKRKKKALEDRRDRQRQENEEARISAEKSKHLVRQATDELYYAALESSKHFPDNRDLKELCDILELHSQAVHERRNGKDVGFLNLFQNFPKELMFKSCKDCRDCYFGECKTKNNIPTEEQLKRMGISQEMERTQIVWHSSKPKL